MRKLGIVAGVAATLLLATQALADTVYLKDGRSFWGREIREEGEWVVVVRPGGDLRFRKGDVSRIEGIQTTLPPFYTPPSGAATAPGGTGPEGGPVPPPQASGATGPSATATPPGGPPPAPPEAPSAPGVTPPGTPPPIPPAGGKMQP